MRYLFILCCSLGLLLCSQLGAAAENITPKSYVMRVAHSTDVTELYTSIAQQQTAKLRELTGGRLEVKKYAAAYQQPRQDIVSLLLDGRLELGVLELVDLIHYAPKFNLLLTPYLFDSYELAYRALDQYLIRWMNQELNPLGLTVIDNFVMGDRNVTTRVWL